MLAEDLSVNLSQMESALKRAVGDFNQQTRSSGSADQDEVNPVAKVGALSSVSLLLSQICFQIVAVLNSHHESLSWLDDKSRYLALYFVNIYA